MITVIALWWWEASGSRAKANKRAEYEARVKAYARERREGNFPAFLRELLGDVRDLTRSLKVALEGAAHYRRRKHKREARTTLEEAALLLQRVIADLADSPEDLPEPEKGPRTVANLGVPLLTNEEAE
jgi:hypothetical protein